MSTQYISPHALPWESINTSYIQCQDSTKNIFKANLMLCLSSCCVDFASVRPSSVFTTPACVKFMPHFPSINHLLYERTSASLRHNAKKAMLYLYYFSCMYTSCSDGNLNPRTIVLFNCSHPITSQERTVSWKEWCKNLKSYHRYNSIPLQT